MIAAVHNTESPLSHRVSKHTRLGLRFRVPARVGVSPTLGHVRVVRMVVVVGVVVVVHRTAPHTPASAREGDEGNGQPGGGAVAGAIPLTPLPPSPKVWEVSEGAREGSSTGTDTVGTSSGADSGGAGILAEAPHRPCESRLHTRALVAVAVVG